MKVLSLPSTLHHNLIANYSSRLIKNDNLRQLLLGEFGQNSLSIEASLPPNSDTATASRAATCTNRNNIDARRMELFCTGIGTDKKCYSFGEAPDPYPIYIKRNLTPDEYFISPTLNIIVLPYIAMERMKNEVATIKFIKDHNTSIPVPNMRCAFEDHGRFYLITDVVPGVMMVTLTEEQKEVVITELQGYISEMHFLKSKAIGGLLGDHSQERGFQKHNGPFRAINDEVDDAMELVKFLKELESHIEADATTDSEADGTGDDK